MRKSNLPVTYDARLAIWRRLGWVELSDAEEDHIWQRFDASFGFFGSGIREPVPSFTWGIRGVFDRSDQSSCLLEEDLSVKVLKAFQACTAPGEPVFALDWMHPCFWFDPRCGVQGHEPDDWAVPVLPNGDHCVFLARDFRFGLIGHMDTSICVFGEHLLAEINTDPPSAFTHLLRRDGLPLNTR